jgi:predicted nucleotidyltransferase
MLSPLERSALDRLRAALGERFGVRLASLVLFGSRARGEGDETSDLDVLVTIRELTRDERHAVLDLADDVERAFGLRIEPLVRDVDPRSLGAALAREIARDGVSL